MSEAYLLGELLFSLVIVLVLSLVLIKRRWTL